MTSRRDFLKTSAGVGVGAAVGMGSARPLLGAPAIRRSVVTPVAVASGNGLEAVATAIEVVNGGGDTLEAVVQGVNIVERDPGDPSVGYGGRPNLDGVVQLDSSVMHGPSRGAGAVACLEGIKTPSSVAMDVMRYTDHVLLVGKGAQRFAVSMGYQIENLLTESSRRRWIEWRARMSDRDDYLVPGHRGAGQRALRGRGDVRPRHPRFARRCAPPGDDQLQRHQPGRRPFGRDHDFGSGVEGPGPGRRLPDRGCRALRGQRCRRVRLDGAGRGRDQDLRLPHRRRDDAAGHVPHRRLPGGAASGIVTFTAEPRLRNDRGLPSFNVNYYAVNKNGEYGGAAIWSGPRFAVCVDGEARHEQSAYLYER